MEITIINSNLYVYILVMLISAFLLFTNKQEFNKENLISYLIYLTNKIIMFTLFVSFLIINIFVLVDLEQTQITNFIIELSNMILFYALFNYSIFYSLKFIGWAIEFFKKNELLTFSLLKEVKTK